MEEDVKQEMGRIRLACYFARQMIEELGEEQALGIIARAYEQFSGDYFQDMAAEHGDDMIGLAKAAKSFPHTEIVEATDEKLAIRVSRCAHYLAWKELGLPQVAPLYCDGDYAATKRFNPRMKVVRTKELARGADHCNHTWLYED